MRASRPADVRRLRRRLGTCRRINTSSRPGVPLRLHRARWSAGRRRRRTSTGRRGDRMEAAVKFRDRGMEARTPVPTMDPSAWARARKEVRKREAIRIARTAMVAGRNFRQWLHAHLLSQFVSQLVSQPDRASRGVGRRWAAQKTADRTAPAAIRVRRAAVTARRDVDTAVTLVRHLT
jgi:hypothetical protein